MGSDSDVSEERKVPEQQIESVTTNERVPGHSAYYEKGGLRTYGDDGDHDHEPPVRFCPISPSAL